MKVTELKALLQRKPMIKLVEYKINGIDTAHKYLNLQRRVCETDSVGFAVAAPRVPGVLDVVSYCNWPKAKELSGNFTRVTLTSECITLTYEVSLYAGK